MKTSAIEVHDMLSVFSVGEVEKRIGEVPGVACWRSGRPGPRRSLRRGRAADRHHTGCACDTCLFIGRADCRARSLCKGWQ